MAALEILADFEGDSNQPLFHMAAEDQNQEDQTNRIGTLWLQDSDGAPLKGRVQILGQTIPVVLFPNENHPAVQE